MKLNHKPAFTEKTHEGAPAARMNSLQALRRSVLSCMLWEREFYEEGEDIATRIMRLAQDVSLTELCNLALEARTQGNLRHVPLLLLCAAARRGGSAMVGRTISAVIQRADELTEFLAIYAKMNGVTPDKIKPKLSAQVKKGLAGAFGKFDEYRLAKYDRDGAIKLRDVLFLCHAKPKDDAQAALWKRLIDGTLETPDTWETQLSGGADKKETFERLIREEKLGYLALLRNLRNMVGAGVDLDLVKEAIVARKGGAERVLPFRYTAAARVVPQLEPSLDQALCESIAAMPVLPGKTIVLVDVSGSMESKLSAKSDLTRMDAAATLAAIIPGDVRMFSFSHNLIEVPPRRGMAGVDALKRSQPHGGTALAGAIQAIHTYPHDRLIVITDEQATAERVPDPKAKHAYMINVASAKNGVGYGRWVHIDGFSEAVLTFIGEHERRDA